MDWGSAIDAAAAWLAEHYWSPTDAHFAGKSADLIASRRKQCAAEAREALALARLDGGPITLRKSVACGAMGPDGQYPMARVVLRDEPSLRVYGYLPGDESWPSFVWPESLAKEVGERRERESGESERAAIDHPSNLPPG